MQTRWITVDGNEAYAHCIAHGIERKDGLSQQAKLDSKPPKIPFGDYAYEETRYRLLRSLNPETARMLALEAQHDIDARWALYESLAKR